MQGYTELGAITRATQMAGGRPVMFGRGHRPRPNSGTPPYPRSRRHSIVSTCDGYLYCPLAMPTPPYPALVFLLALFSGWVNRRQQRGTEPDLEARGTVGSIHRQDRLGGVLRYYHRAA